MTEENLNNSELQEKPKKSGRILWRVVSVLGFAFLILLGLQLQSVSRGALQLGDPAPEFVLTTFEGEEIRLSELRGQVVVVNVWASWCTPCEEEAAELQQAWEYYAPGGEVVFLGIDDTDTLTAALEYLDRFSVTYPNGPDWHGTITDDYMTTGVPETFIIDREGILVDVKIGPFSSLEEIIITVDRVINRP